jgi:hypothetical protein
VASGSSGSVGCFDVNDYRALQQECKRRGLQGQGSKQVLQQCLGVSVGGMDVIVRTAAPAESAYLDF